MSGSSPWGSIQHVTQLERGIAFVSTPSHGGVRVSMGYAKAKLSEAARKRGIEQNNYLFFEEDCNYAIPLFKLSHLWAKAFPNSTYEDVEKQLFLSLSTWNPDFLMDIGLMPEATAYNLYLQRKERDRMHAAKNPNLIICAQSTDNKDQVKVTTADGVEHLVTNASYDCRRALNLLSNCEVIVGVVEP